MDSSQKPHRLPRKIYQSHRDSQRERILDAAEALFIQSGIEGVTLADIARSARLSRVTLYEYFPDKKEIAWAIFQKVVREMRDASGEQQSLAEGSGYQKLEAFVDRMMGLLNTHPNQLHYIAVFNFLYGNDGGAARMRDILEQNWPGYYGLPADWIHAGIRDGSIRANVDPDLTAAALFNLLAGMSSRFALLGSVVKAEYAYGEFELFREICCNFLGGIRAGSSFGCFQAG
ncbi:MAG: TetR/AcrR family transcriptional regulator [Anaerolineaceae bacterium]|nr:TetR/AcrR family transcriptional regulator [Anaerolineaceae bacterium]